MFPAVARRLASSDTLASRGLAKVAAAVALLLVVLLAERLAVLTWMLVPQAELPAPTLRIDMDNAPQVTGSSTLGYESIAGLHLFGEVKAEALQKETEPLVVNTEEVPETDLQLQLRGVYFSGNQNLARAIIAEANGREEIYAVGERLPGGAQIRTMEPTRVVLARSGRLEALAFPVDSAIANAGARLLGPSRGAATARRIDASDLVGRYRDNVEDDPSALLDIAQIQPFHQDGQFQGIQVRPGRRRNLLRELGLQSGDVITAIDGSSLDSMAQAMQSLGALADVAEVSATILRNGQEIPYMFQLQ